MFKSMENPGDAQGYSLEIENENGQGIGHVSPARTPEPRQPAQPSRFSRPSLGRARQARLVRNLNRSLAIVEDNGFLLSGGCLTALDGALLGFLAEARLQHAGSGGSSLGRQGRFPGEMGSSTPRLTRTQSPGDQEDRSRARGASKRDRKGGKPNG